MNCIFLVKSLSDITLHNFRSIKASKLEMETSNSTSLMEDMAIKFLSKTNVNDIKEMISAPIVKSPINIKGTVMQIEKALINDRSRVSKVS